MHIIIFGATGQAGLQLVKQALWKGHTVKAFGRNVYDIIDMENERLTLIKGALFDEAEVREAIKGTDAVLSALGGAFDGTDKTRSLGMKNIAAQMEATGVRRIIGIGGMGVLNANEEHLVLDMEGYPPEYLPVGHEHLAAYEVLKQSNLDWTFVCPPDIINAEATGVFQTRADYPPEPSISITTGDLALFMLNELEKNEFVKSRVGISN